MSHLTIYVISLEYWCNFVIWKVRHENSTKSTGRAGGRGGGEEGGIMERTDDLDTLIEKIRQVMSKQMPNKKGGKPYILRIVI